MPMKVYGKGKEIFVGLKCHWGSENWKFLWFCDSVAMY